MVIGFDILTF